MNCEDIIEAIIDKKSETLRTWFDTMDEGTFEIWYSGAVAFLEAMEYHVNYYGLEHLRDRYRR